VGTGIRAVSQVTPESRARIERADLVLYSVGDAVSEQWLCEQNPRCRPLTDLYRVGEPRQAIYAAMVARVMEAVRSDLEVCLALYGHPGVCARAGHESIQLARAEGYAARMLPGVSCEDCLFADLGVDPATAGCQSHEASTFAERGMAFDPRAALLLWQIGMLGCHDYQQSYKPRGLQALAAQLAAGYGAAHKVLLYELPAYAASEPLLRRVAIAGLPETPLTWATTLYAPPLA
jgi:hypothetical protein